MLHPAPHELSRNLALTSAAVHAERVHGKRAMRPITEWLAAQGQDLQLQLNRQLCGHPRMSADEVRSLLERGADPNWIAPNGIPVLEHIMLRCWSGEAVDAVAPRTVPRPALWIAAGLGDVQGVAAFLDADGKPLPSSRQHRPQWEAVGGRGLPSIPEPSDEELLVEALLVAMLNGRTRVLDYLASRGANVNSMMYSMPLVSFAVGNGLTAAAESLIRCGADLDLKGWHPDQSARQVAHDMYVAWRFSDEYRPIVVMCGLDPNAIMAEENAKPVPEPTGHRTLQIALELAMDDAFRQGRQDATPENLWYGLLRAGGTPLDLIVRRSGMDSARFHVDVQERVRPGTERASEAPLPAAPDGQVVLDRMIAAAKAQRRREMTAMHLLRSLLLDESGPAARTITQYGGSVLPILDILSEKNL